MINPDIYILAEDRSAGGPDEDQKSDLPYTECWNRYHGYDDPARPSFLSIVEKEKPDIIHWSHEFGLFCLTQKTANEYLVLLEKINRLGIKQTIVYHSVPQIPNRFFTEYFNQSSPLLDKIVVHTNEQLLSLKNDYKVPQSKLIHINHGVKLCPLYEQAEARRKLGIPLDKKVIMSMGFFGGLKGVEELIDVHSDIIKTNPDVLFYFVGGLHYATAAYGKQYMKECFRKILGKQLRNKFFITGFVPEETLPYYYAASNLAVLNYKPSGYLSPSGCSAKLTASKRLIITTDGTHRNDELENNKQCIKVPYNDMNKMRTEIINSLEEDNTPIIENAYKYALENQWAKISEEYINEVWK